MEDWVGENWVVGEVGEHRVGFPGSTVGVCECIFLVLDRRKKRRD